MSKTKNRKRDAAVEAAASPQATFLIDPPALPDALAHRATLEGLAKMESLQKATADAGLDTEAIDERIETLKEAIPDGVEPIDDGAACALLSEWIGSALPELAKVYFQMDGTVNGMVLDPGADGGDFLTAIDPLVPDDLRTAMAQAGLRAFYRRTLSGVSATIGSLIKLGGVWIRGTGIAENSGARGKAGRKTAYAVIEPGMFRVGDQLAGDARSGSEIAADMGVEVGSGSAPRLIAEHLRQQGKGFVRIKSGVIDKVY